MSEVTLSFPLDDDKFLRRECPDCEKEFKIQTIEKDGYFDSGLDKQESNKMTCPYCGHRSKVREWWTKDQVNYISQENERIAFDLIQNELGGSMINTGLIQVTLTPNTIPKTSMNPEKNDMKIFELSCCERDIKILENWTEKVYCPDCSKIYKI